ncbi:zf-RVT domain-containing protein, partial [Cephalotus follicularis]
TWEYIRTSAPSIHWSNLVWYPANISKHAFCLWLAIRGAHRTLDKLSGLGIISSACCVFNCGDIESQDHLFFACSYTKQIWTQVLRKCNINRPILTWTEEIQWMAGQTKGNKPPQTIRKLAFGATVYHIWMERNRRIFKNRFLPVESIVHKIQCDVAGKMAGLNMPFDQVDERHHSLGTNWGLLGN